MKSVLPLVFLLCLAIPAHAQNQERKLVDRIMKPDMTLANDAQNKKFRADKTPVNKRAEVGTFYLQQKSANKRNFSGTRDFSSWQFNASHGFRDSRAANLSTRTTVPNSKYRTSGARQISASPDAGKQEATRNFAGDRPFLVEGKSQKSLSQQKRPMTIDEVRALLNKNK